MKTGKFQNSNLALESKEYKSRISSDGPFVWAPEGDIFIMIMPLFVHERKWASCWLWQRKMEGLCWCHLSCPQSFIWESFYLYTFLTFCPMCSQLHCFSQCLRSLGRVEGRMRRFISRGSLVCPLAAHLEATPEIQASSIPNYVMARCNGISWLWSQLLRWWMRCNAMLCIH